MAAVPDDARVQSNPSAEPWHAERSVAERRRRRHRAHAVIVVGGWLVLAAFWVRAVSIADASVVTTILTVVGAGLIGTLAVTLVWIAHNLRIHRRKGPRTTVPPVEERFTHDSVGRRLAADWEAVVASSLLRIAAGPDEKRYIAAGDATGCRSGQERVRVPAGEIG